jgi:SAM-dependent methyltransferase
MLEYEAIADRLALDRPGHVLDWGCGLGHITHLLRERDVRVTAFDYEADLPEDGVFRRDYFPDIEMHLTSDPIRLPFDDGSFDTVLSCGVLEHVADPDGSLEEIKRVLSPGGRLYVFKLANRFSYTQRISRVAGLYYHGALPNDRIYKKHEAISLLERHGYRVVECRLANMLPLTVGLPVGGALSRVIWGANRALARLPALNVVATDLELVGRVSRCLLPSGVDSPSKRLDATSSSSLRLACR